MTRPVRLTVIGSINLDFVASGPALPAPGETVTGATLARHPGGKGANQALAAQRLGARVRLIAAVGDDALAGDALAQLRAGGVDLSGVRVTDQAPTGVALIAVAPDGENQIIVASGANACLSPEDIDAVESDATLCVLEVPVETVVAARERTDGFFAVNLAPALPVPEILLSRADLLITNEGEAAAYGETLHTGGGLVAVTYGGRGAALLRDGTVIAKATPPDVTPVDTTGAGDTFSAALTVGLCEGMAPDAALAFAVTAGAAATLKPGAQPSLPTRSEVTALMPRSAYPNAP